MRVLTGVLMLWWLWWSMMAVHECGHILSALVNGGIIDRVVLWPWTFSRTDRHGSAHESIDLLLGPLIGVLIPLLFYIVVIVMGAMHTMRAYAWRWAALCLIVNGVYVAAGWIAGTATDSGELVARGVSPWLVVTGGLLSTSAGLAIAHVELERYRRARIGSGSSPVHPR